MALLKIFVSSTCYDLGMLRAELRSYISNFGYDPVMSDYNDVLFDPKDHTHESCVKEVANADIIVLIIGARFGGKAVPQAISQLDIEKLKTYSKGTKLLETPENISITQVEILRAVELNIPIFTFVESKVLHDHLLYEKNKDKEFVDKIDFGSIEKKETAKYIFEFINYLRLRAKNNSIFGFTNISDIQDILKKQLSALLQRTLQAQRNEVTERKQINYFLEGLSDIKSLILTSIGTDQGKEIGKGVIRYRRLIDFFQGLQVDNVGALAKQNINWDELLKQIGIREIIVLDNTSIRYRNTTFLLMQDNTFFECRYHIGFIQRLAQEWSTFKQLPDQLKDSIVGAILESDQHSLMMIRKINQQFDEFLKELEEKNLTSSTTTTTTINPKTIEDTPADNDGPVYGDEPVNGTTDGYH